MKTVNELVEDAVKKEMAPAVPVKSKGGRPRLPNTKNKRVRAFVALYKQNLIYDKDCEYFGKNCDKHKSLTQMKLEAGYGKGTKPGDIKSGKRFIELMGNFEEELEKKVNPDYMIDKMAESRDILVQEEMDVAVTATRIVKDILANIQNPEELKTFLGANPAAATEKIQNVASKAVKTSRLAAGESTENVAVQVQISQDEGRIVSAFSNRQEVKNKHNAQGEEKRQAEEDAERKQAQKVQEAVIEE